MGGSQLSWRRSADWLLRSPQSVTGQCSKKSVNKMASFYSIFGILAVNTFQESDPGTFDMISCLPIEMALTILRLLPGKDLVNAVLVNKRWLELCKSDRKLRQKVRRYLRQLRRARLAVLTGQGLRGRARDSPLMRNVTNEERPSTSRHRENGMLLSRAGNRLPLLYQIESIEKPKKRRNVKVMNCSVKKLRL